MTTKKKKTTKSTTKASTQKAQSKKRDTVALAAMHAEAIGHEDAGRWADAAAMWARIQPLCISKAERKEAAGRAAAARVRASSEATETEPLDEQLERSSTASANAANWEQAMPEPGYVPPADSDMGAQVRDDTADDGTGDDDVVATNDAPTGTPDANGAAAQAKVGRAQRERDPRLPPTGTVLIKRDRRGAERTRCTIVEGGVEYASTIYKSLSAAAVAAAKDLGLGSKTQDGYAFWQLKKPAPREQDPVAALDRAWERYRAYATAAAKTADDEERTKVHAALHEHVAALTALTIDTNA